ncbi:MAG: ATP synthase F1 subunit gamma [Clostridia bacterium]|nr:ATP synthase F1 subunit gamma [Clostridia bacterium]
MGADIKGLRVRIKSVSSTQHLTKAMGLVASSKIRKSNMRMQKSLEYSNTVCETINELSACRECQKSPYMRNAGGDRLRLIVIAGDRGLAGGYNANIFRLMREYENADVIPIGKRATERYGKETVLAETFSYSDAKALSTKLCKDFANGEFDKLGIVYTKYHSMMSQEATIRYVLPLEKNNNEKSMGAIFEPDELTVLNAAVPEYVTGVLVACVKESVASEVSARRVAMDSADKNAQEMLSQLSLEYNRARQSSITQEITEIVAGSGL